MRKDSDLSDNIIRGNCSLFVCKICRTKYGWEHQKWCEYYSLTLPSCKDCRYFSENESECIHPTKKLRKETLAYEETQGSV